MNKSAKWNLYFLIALALLQASTAAAQEKLDLRHYLTYLEDPGTTLTFEQVKSKPVGVFTRPAEKGFVAPNPGTAVYWIKIDLRGEKNIAFEGDPVLYLPFREFTSLTYYKPLANGDYKPYQIGRQYGLAQKDISSPHIAFSSDPEGWKQAPIYFRVDFRGYSLAKTIPAFLYSHKEFSKKAQTLSIVAAITYAIFFTVLIYNAVFCLAIREKFLVYYFIYLASSWIVCMGNDGVWSTWVMPGGNDLSTRILDVVTITGCIAIYLEFICEILQVKKNMPWIIWPVRTVYLYGFISATAILFGVDLIEYPVFGKNIFGSYSLCFSIFIFCFSIYKKIPYARVIAPASFSPVLFGAIYSAYLSGDIPYNEYLPHTMSTGFVLEILAISVMIAVKIRQIIGETEAAKVESLVAMRNARQQQNLATEKSRFLAHVSHDMRQPLYVLRLQLVLLKTKIIDPVVLSTVAAMKSSINSIEAMFEDILYMSLLESGGIVPEKELINMVDLLQTIRSEFSSEAESRGIRLVTFCTRDAQINTDRQILKRILRNLVQNAIRHTESGGVLIACRRRGDNYRIDVIDSGFGIDKISQEKLFKASGKIPGSKTLEGNFGLGLSIVATLTGLINAAIEVKSEPNKGSRFSIYL